MFGGKPREAWRATLEEAVGFEPAHVSAYGLTYEGDTPFGQRAEEAVGDDEYLGLYQEAERVLGDYDHYEISNYALPGRGCRHNLVYWHNEEYAGFGLGAYGFVQGVRSRNTLSLEDYLDAPGKHKEESLVLTPQEIRLETVIQYLRLRDGLALGDYQARFGRDLWEEFGSALEALEARGLIVRAGDVIRPTAQGFYLNNEIF